MKFFTNPYRKIQHLKGLFIIALRLLANDTGKFFTLVTGIMFAVFLIMQMTSSFSGLMQRTAADIINVGAKIWVMDQSVHSARDIISLPNYVLDAVKSISGVDYAAPIYNGGGLLRMGNGSYQAVTIIGLDDATLLGRPKIIEGNLNAIYNNDAFIVIKNNDYVKLGNPKIGTNFEINDHRGTTVALAKVALSGLFGTPTLYTTYNRAIATLPTSRFTISYIFIEPKNAANIPYIKEEVKKLGYVALTEKEFIAKNTNYYVFKTGMGLNILMMTLISFVIGLSIAGQTFYTFVLENLEKFGALKAIGAKKYDLMYMILSQALVVGFLGYGAGVFLSSLVIAFGKIKIPNYAPTVTSGAIIFSFFIVLIIVAFASYLGIRKILKIEPFDVFRG